MNTTTTTTTTSKISNNYSSSLNEDSSRISIGSTNRSKVVNRLEVGKQKSLSNWEAENATETLYACSKMLQEYLQYSIYLNCVETIVNDFAKVSQYSDNGKYSINADELDQAIVHDSNSGKAVKVKDLIIEKIKRCIVCWIMSKKYCYRNLDDWKSYSSGEFYQFQEICCGQLFHQYQRLKPSLQNRFPDFFNPFNIKAWDEGEAVLQAFMHEFYPIKLERTKEKTKDIHTYTIEMNSFILENYK